MRQFKIDLNDSWSSHKFRVYVREEVKGFFRSKFKWQELEGYKTLKEAEEALKGYEGLPRYYFR